MVSHKRPIVILEDEPLDAYTMTKELSRVINNPIVPLSSARQVQDFLLRRREYAALTDKDLPVAMLFDVRIPGLSGFELVQWCKEAGPQIAAIPIVLCSQWNDRQTSDAENRVLSKPVDGDVFLMELLANPKVRCRNRIVFPATEGSE
jgi:CheY-like chemotaxis protein